MPNTSTPAPISWPPSSHWDGNDGLWNTFIVEVGTPPQSFRTLPSTAGQETWIPVPDGCTSVTPFNPGYCGYLRGAIPSHGINSTGFATNASSTWENIGIYTLDAQEAELGYSGNGLYGFDTVAWGNSTGMNLTSQVVAGIATTDYWMGLVGLGPKTINFTTFNDPIPSYLSNLVNESKIPSHSWAYTAGAAYRNKSKASLTLGGYDSNRITGSSISVPMNADNSRPLQIAVQKIVTQNTLIGTSNLLPTSTYHFIDSTIPHIWLPNDAISQFVSAFGLIYDNTTDLYLVNDPIHARLLDLNPTITFVIAESTSSGTSDTISIDFPYAAFDLQASYPFYENSTNYFPIRRAANESQYTIGRTFFQEAYVVADYERSNFSISKTTFTKVDEEQLVAIEKPVASASATKVAGADDEAALSAGAIAGVVIGAVAGLAIVAVIAWLLIRRRRKQKGSKAGVEATSRSDETKPAGAEKRASLIKHKHDSELPSENCLHEAEVRCLLPEIDSPAIHEAEGLGITAEVDGGTARWGGYGVQELPTPPGGNVAEVPGSEGVRYELAASDLEGTGRRNRDGTGLSDRKARS